ncbi:HAMP domain-containing protein [Candidatus Pacearchaeota archaeon]|nr:HAMP domain-containing protein [Candidatus Pacearchaeota archaeon]
MNSRLEARLLNYFLLIAFAVILIGIEFYFEMDAEHGLHICGNSEHHDANQDTTNPLSNLRNKILIMFLVLSIVVAIVLTMFIQNIATPLCKMALVARRINDGDLSQTVNIDNNDEIGEVGIAINELASNLQEVATFTSSATRETLEKINILKELAPDNQESIEAINHIEKKLLSMKSFADSFTLLDTELSNA